MYQFFFDNSHQTNNEMNVRKPENLSESQNIPSDYTAQQQKFNNNKYLTLYSCSVGIGALNYSICYKCDMLSYFLITI